MTAVCSSVYTVSVGGITGNGTLGLNLVDNGAIRDLAGNPLAQLNGAAAFATQATYATGTGPESVVLADLNGDGTPDIVTANYGDNSVSVLLGNGNGTFAPETVLAGQSHPIGVTVADVNGDGKPDIIVANQGDSSVSVFLGNGDGTFAMPTSFAVGQFPEAVVVADVNGDGKLDLIVPDEGPGTISVLLGNGDGTFQTQATFATGANPRSLAVADLNGDGKPDIVAANFSSNNVSVLLGNGDGTFAPQTTFATGANPRSVAVADVNGDGTPDIVTANYGNNTVSVLLGNGDGTFAPQATFSTDGSPNSVAIADVNGDGKPDIVTANYGGNDATVLLGNGDGTFQTQANFAAGAHAYSVAVGDLNGDGKPDIVTANYSGSSVNVLLNNANGNFAGQVYTVVLPTTTVLAAAPAPSTYGQSVTFTATVTSGGSPVTTGSVTFYEGAVVLAAAVSLDGSGDASFSMATLSASASPHTVTAVYNAGSSYATSFGTASQTVNRKTLTVTGIIANDKVYDGTTTAALNTGSAELAAVVTGDSVTLDMYSATAFFASANVGTSILVTIAGLTLGGADAGNYLLAQPTANANITPLLLTGSITAADKVYDGATAATITGRGVSGVLMVDMGNVSLTGGTATFSDKNAGNDKTVTATGLSLTGSAADDYSVSTSATTTADTTPRTLTVTATGTDKVYDGNITATVSFADDRVSGDVFTEDDAAATFPDKNVGSAKTVTVSGITINGTDAANYTLASTDATTSANITPRTLTVSATGSDKVYDGTTGATVTLADNRISGDVFNDDDAAANFDDKNVGAAKTVTVNGININGSDAANYTLASTGATTTANITPRTLTVSATASDKVYDGTTGATVTLVDNRVSGDVFNDDDAAANFDDKNVGAAKTVTVTGITINGSNAANYTLASTGATTSANITPRALTVSATGSDKVYDGTTGATVTLVDNRVSGDIFNDDDAAANFDDKNVGAAKTVTVIGITINGSDAANYTLASTGTTTTANITPRTLTVSATASDKIYDGTIAVAVTLADNRISGDVFNDDDAAANFDDKNVGAAKTVTVNGINHQRQRCGQLHTRQHRRDDLRQHHFPDSHSERHRQRQGLRWDHGRDRHSRR